MKYIVLIAALIFVDLPLPPTEPCPPYWQCTPRGEWNAPNCRCWDSK